MLPMAVPTSLMRTFSVSLGLLTAVTAYLSRNLLRATTAPAPGQPILTTFDPSCSQG